MYFITDNLYNKIVENKKLKFRRLFSYGLLGRLPSDAQVWILHFGGGQFGGHGGGGGGQFGGHEGVILIKEFDLKDVWFWLKDCDVLGLLLWANKVWFKVNDDVTRATPKIVHKSAILHLSELLLQLWLFFIKIQ